MIRKIVFALVAALGLVFVSLPAAADEETKTEIIAMSPEVIYPNQDLTLTLSTTGPVGAESTIEIYLEQTYINAPDQAERYLSEQAFPGWRIVADRVDTSTVKTTAEGTEFQVVIPADLLAAEDPGGAGLRGLTAELTTGDFNQSARTLIMNGTDEFPQTQVSVVAVNPPDSTPLANVAGVNIASPSESAEIQLPAESADLSLLAAANESTLLELAEGTLSEPHSGVVVATEQGFSQSAVANLVGRPIIAPASWTSPTSLVTPTSLTAVGEATILDQWDTAARLLSLPVSEPSAELVIRQQLRSAGMWVGLEDPADQRTLLVTVTEPDAPEVIARIEALLGNPWIQPVSVSDVLTSEVSTIARPPIPESSTEATEVEAILTPLVDSYLTAKGIAEATSEGSALVLSHKAEILAPTAMGLTPKERTRLVSTAVSKLDPITKMVSVVPLETVNVVNNSANFPVSVRNNGEVAIAVEVSLSPSDARLQSKKSAFATVPAGGQVDVSIPVTAVGYGDVEATIVAATAGGTVLDESQTVSVRVRASWEDVGTIAVLSVLGLLFVFGLIRTVLKRRKRKGISK